MQFLAALYCLSFPSVQSNVSLLLALSSSEFTRAQFMLFNPFKDTAAICTAVASVFVPKGNGISGEKKKKKKNPFYSN